MWSSAPVVSQVTARTPSVFWSSCAKLTRLVVSSNVGQLMWSHYPMGVGFKMSIGTTTHIVFCDHTTRYTISVGNWLYNSWRLAVSCWYVGVFFTHGGCEHMICVHHAYDVRHMWVYVRQVGGVGMGQWGVVRIYIHRSTQIRKYEC